MKNLAIISILILLLSCSEDDDVNLLPVPDVATVELTELTINSVKTGGLITATEGTDITAKGVVWSTSPNPTVDLGTKTNEGSDATNFTSTVAGLSANTTYYLRAYATYVVSYDNNSFDTVYGNEISFSTIIAPNFFLAENGVTCICEDVVPGST